MNTREGSHMKSSLKPTLSWSNEKSRITSTRGFRLSCIAPDDNRHPQMKHRFWVFPLVFIPWLLIYEFVVYRGPSSAAFTTYLPGEWGWPIWQPMELFYVSAYILVTLAPFLAPTNRILRQFTIAGLLSIVLGNLIFLTVPAIAPPRPFQPFGLFGRMMVTDRNLDLNNGTAAFPSFHVVWSFIGAAVFVQRWPRIRFVFWSWATLVSASCILTGMHSLADVAAGFLLFVTIHNYPSICARAKLRRQDLADFGLRAALRL